MFAVAAKRKAAPRGGDGKRQAGARAFGRPLAENVPLAAQQGAARKPQAGGAVAEAPVDNRPLNAEQTRVLEAVKAGRNVFFTGSAGTGKSFLLQRLRRELVARHGAGRVFVTAPTGSAAVNIGGETLHSFAGIGVGAQPIDQLVRRVFHTPATADRWRNARTLIVDEISMVDGKLLDTLDQVARRIRGRELAFGGIQVVFCGDFYQLPPVRVELFAFEARAWHRAMLQTHQLQTVLRQKGDDAFVALLNEIRVGKVSADTHETLLSLQRALQPPNGITPTRLFATNTMVDRVNQAEMAKLGGAAASFAPLLIGSEAAVERLQKNCPAAERLEVRVGAQVVLTRNLSPTLVNGSRGVVVDLCEATPTNVQAHASSRATMQRMQWLYQQRTGGNKPVLPVVRFASGELEQIAPAEWSTLAQGREGVCVQIPLKAAWAATTHRAQGMTLDYVEVNLAGSFDYGQCYVALSRARAMAGLRVLGFSPSAVKVHPKVAAFMSGN